MANSGLNFVQLAEGSASATPLILIHDGGGTVLSYKALGSLDRDVYGISNPRFDNGQPWEGGIPEMARSYTQMIKARIPKGDLLLGGWSFGGYLAMEISHNLANDDDLRIVGLIMIDSPYPKIMDGNLRDAINSQLPDLIGIRPDMRRKIHSSIKHARVMLSTWQPPKWDSDALDQDMVEKRPPPSVTLLRSIEPVTRRGGKVEPVGVVDIFRHDPLLGWNQFRQGFIQVAWNIPGNHYTIFGTQNVPIVTEKIASACAYLCGSAAA